VATREGSGRRHGARSFLRPSILRGPPSRLAQRGQKPRSVRRQRGLVSAVEIPRSLLFSFGGRKAGAVFGRRTAEAEGGNAGSRGGPASLLHGRGGFLPRSLLSGLGAGSRGFVLPFPGDAAERSEAKVVEVGWPPRGGPASPRRSSDRSPSWTPLPFGGGTVAKGWQRGEERLRP